MNSRNQVYTYVTESIIRKLKEGVIPWRKPWRATTLNYVSRRPYRGINLLLLSRPGEYLTFNQIKKLNGRIKEGSKSEMVVFYKLTEIKDKNQEDKVKKIPFLRYYRVFHVSDCEGIPSISDAQEPETKETIKDCDEIVQNWNVPIVHENPDRAFYTPTLDYINVPTINLFETSEEFYSTLFHEMVHSTGHKSRLNRFTNPDQFNFGSHAYSKEELIAEIGSAMLCTITGIENRTLDNSTSYIDGWIKKLEGDHTLIVSAANKAQKAVDLIQGIKETEEEVTE